MNILIPKNIVMSAAGRNNVSASGEMTIILCLVAGVTKNQITELHANGITTATALAAMPTPMPWKPQRGSPLSYAKAREQARIQIETRQAGTLQYELLPVVPETGLCLPLPRMAMCFLTSRVTRLSESTALSTCSGTAIAVQTANLPIPGSGRWTEREKAIFEHFVDFVTTRREEYPDLHIYHYAPYEPGALKRLMGRYATREDEVDRMLRGRSSSIFMALCGMRSRQCRKLLDQRA